MRSGVVDRLNLAPLLRVGLIAALAAVPAPLAAQQAPSPADLPAAYRGTNIDKALKAHNWPQAESLLVAAIDRTPDSPELLTRARQRVPRRTEAPERRDCDQEGREDCAAESGHAIHSRARVIQCITASGPAQARDPRGRRRVEHDGSILAGRIDYDYGRYDAAVGRFTKVVEGRPDRSARARQPRPLLRGISNQPDIAVEHYRKAVALNHAATTKSGWPSLNLGILLRTRGELAKPRRSCARRCATAGLPQAHYQLGALLENRIHLDQAVHELKRAIELQADYAQPSHALARIYRRQGHGAEADQALATFRRLHDAARPVPAP